MEGRAKKEGVDTCFLFHVWEAKSNSNNRSRGIEACNRLMNFREKGVGAERD